MPDMNGRECQRVTRCLDCTGPGRPCVPRSQRGSLAHGVGHQKQGPDSNPPDGWAKEKDIRALSLETGVRDSIAQREQNRRKMKHCLHFLTQKADLLYTGELGKGLMLEIHTVVCILQILRLK